MQRTLKRFYNLDIAKGKMKTILRRKKKFSKNRITLRPAIPLPLIFRKTEKVQKEEKNEFALA
jgi:hypothetical protein